MPAPVDDTLITFARRIYFFSLWGLIPLCGLLIGPLALPLGLFTLVRGRQNDNLVCTKLGMITIGVGALTAVTNWLGLWLILRGLSG